MSEAIVWLQKRVVGRDKEKRRGEHGRPIGRDGQPSPLPPLPPQPLYKEQRHICKICRFAGSQDCMPPPPARPLCCCLRLFIWRQAAFCFPPSEFPLLPGTANVRTPRPIGHITHVGQVILRGGGRAQGTKDIKRRKKMSKKEQKTKKCRRRRERWRSST